MSLFGPACMGCGCTDDRACMTADGPCRWISNDPPICSACAPEAMPPANDAALICAHSFLYVDSVNSYCVHCGERRQDEAA